MDSTLLFNDKPKATKGSKLRQLINQIDADPNIQISFRAAEEADKELLLKKQLITDIMFLNPSTRGKLTLIGTVEEIVDRIWDSVVKVVK